MATQLEQSLAAICAEHGLESIGLTLMTPASMDRTWFHVDVQWIGNAGRTVATSNADSIAQALGNALSEMAAKRSTAEPVALPDEALTPLAA